MNEIERLRFMLLYDRVEALEKKVADLEVQVQGQQSKKFVAEDSSGRKHYDGEPKVGC